MRAPPKCSMKSTISSSISTPPKTSSIFRSSTPTRRPASHTASSATPPRISSRCSRKSSLRFPRRQAIPRPLQIQVTNLDYSDFLGRIAIARVFQGTLVRGTEVGIAKLDGKILPTKITKLFTFRGLERDEAEEVTAGDIVAIAGVEGIQIGETITDLANPAPLEPLID